MCPTLLCPTYPDPASVLRTALFPNLPSPHSVAAVPALHTTALFPALPLIIPSPLVFTMLFSLPYPNPILSLHSLYLTPLPFSLSYHDPIPLLLFFAALFPTLSLPHSFAAVLHKALFPSLP